MGWFSRRVERRAVELAGGYAEQVIALQSDLLTGNAARPRRLAAAECGAGLIARQVAAGRVEAGRFTPLITPDLLSGVVRGMVFFGEQAVWGRMVAGDYRLELVRHQWLTTGELQVEELIPEANNWFLVSPDDVAIAKWDTDPRYPYRGISPLTNSTTELAANATAVLLRESLNRHGYIMPYTNKPTFAAQSNPELVKDASRRIDDKLSGRAADDPETGQMQAATLGQGYAGPSPNKQWMQVRYGLDPPSEVREITEYACMDTLRALGVPPILFSKQTTADRQAFRNFVAVTCAPVALKIAAELSRIIGEPVTIDLSPQRPADDLVSRSRSVGSLVSAGVDVERALEIAGLTTGGASPVSNDRRAASSGLFPPGGGLEPRPVAVPAGGAAVGGGNPE